MSDPFDILQEQYQALVARKEKGETEEEFLEDVRAFITDAQRAGATVADLNDRSQLRAWMRFLANVLYDATGVYPDATLQPLGRGQLVSLQPEHREKPSPSFPLAWMLVGGAAAVVIAAGLVVVGWLSRPPESVEEIPTPAPMPFVIYAAVGTELDTSDTLKTPADTFCLGTPEIVAEVALAGVEPEMVWHWEVQREGEVVVSQQAAPWGQETRHVIHALTGNLEGVEPGRYDLLVYVGERVVGIQSFRVLDTVPRVFNPRVADVPEPSEEAADGSDGNEFETGVRVIYLSYEYEGLCPGLDVSHTLYHEGGPIQKSVESWSSDPQGQTRVSFQAPGDLPFPPGDYEVAVAVAGKEQARVGFTMGLTIEETETEMEVEKVPPAIGDVTIALGVQPDGTPILTAQANRFDWNTKVVYAIFDYVGMGDKTRWAAVWMRNGQDVAREEHFWNVESAGTEGTRWTAYHAERGRLVPGGNYSVTLYIENVAQHTAEFNIIYYVPLPTKTP